MGLSLLCCSILRREAMALLSIFPVVLLLAISSPAHAMFATSGEFLVDEMGGANYTIPIAVPPGTAGMAPSLSLYYTV